LTCSSDAAGKDFWDRTLANYRPQMYPGPIFEFHDLYRRHLPSNGEMTFLEIGAMPGNHMVYFHREFGYRVTGIDYCSDLTPIVRTMEVNGVRDYSLVNADVFTLSNDKRYDVVFSTGFVEHFEDYRKVITVHVEAVKPGGFLLITVPNATRLHGFLMREFCPDLLAIHRTFLMDRRELGSIVESLGCEVVHCNYLRTFRPFYPLPRALVFVARVANKLLRLAHLDRIPNAFASPYLYLVARKREA
jgi:SAM-dependent methyltransferase